MIDRSFWHHSMRKFLETAESPTRLTTVIRRALDATVPELTREDFVQLHCLMKLNGWRRKQSVKFGDRWHRPVEAEGGDTASKLRGAPSEASHRSTDNWNAS